MICAGILAGQIMDMDQAAGADRLRRDADYMALFADVCVCRQVDQGDFVIDRNVLGDCKACLPARVADTDVRAFLDRCEGGRDRIRLVKHDRGDTRS